MPQPVQRYSRSSWILRGLLLMLFSGFVASLLGVLVYRWVNPNLTMLMVIKHDRPKVSSRENKISKEWVSIEKISPSMILAAVSAEDNRFVEHWGFDLESIRKAVKHNQRSKRVKGASTISQQTAKNVFLWPQRSWLRKGLEAYFTLIMEALWTKERIMEVYLNVAEMGKNLYGVQAASRAYFNCDAAKLTRYQAAMLTAVLPSPEKRNPSRPSSYMYRYQQRVLWNMNNIVAVDFSWKAKLQPSVKPKPKKKR